MGKGGLSENCLMISVIIVNMLCGILGALIFSLAVWMRIENEVKDWISEIGMSQYWTGLYILMAGGIITVLVSFCGCCGALMSNSKLLCTNLSLSSLTFVFFMFGSLILLLHCVSPTIEKTRLHEVFGNILQRKDFKSQEFLIFLYYASGIIVFAAIILDLAGGIFTIRNGSKNSAITPWLHSTINELIIDSNYNPRSNRILQLIQEKVGCCGSVNYQDYERARLPISDYCRDAVSGNVYQDGCVERFSVFIEKRAGWIGGIAIFCACLQIIALTSLILVLRLKRKGEEIKANSPQRKNPSSTPRSKNNQRLFL